MIELLHAGDPRRKKLEKLRQQIAAARDAIAELNAAPLTMDEALAIVMEETGEQLAALNSALRQRFDPGQRGPLVPRPLMSGGGDMPIFVSGGVDALAVHRFAIGDKAFEAAMRERLAAIQPAASASVSAADRPARRAKLEADLAAALDAEAAELAKLEAKGLYANRAPIDPDDNAAVDRFLRALEGTTLV